MNSELRTILIEKSTLFTLNLEHLYLNVSQQTWHWESDFCKSFFHFHFFDCLWIIQFPCTILGYESKLVNWNLKLNRLSRSSKTRGTRYVTYCKPEFKISRYYNAKRYNQYKYKYKNRVCCNAWCFVLPLYATRDFCSLISKCIEILKCCQKWTVFTVFS